MGHEIDNLIKVWLSASASLCYCYLIASNIPKGKLRLLALLPILCLFTILPLCLSTILPAGITALFLTWLANFKLLLFSFDQGPLSLSSSNPPNSLLHFIFIACLPIRIKQNNNYPSHQTPKSSENSSQNQQKRPILGFIWPIKVLLFALFLTLDYENNVHYPMIKLVAYCCMFYLLVDIIFGFCNATVHTMLGVELQPPSDQPFFSTSLQDFWSRRWNLMVTNILRHTVYNPIRSSLETWSNSRWAPLPALMAAFVVSGLMHELIFYYLTRATPTWEVTCFFVLNGTCLVVEFALKRLPLTANCRLHWVVSGPLTVAFVVVTASWLFFPPLLRTGVDVKAIEECKILMGFVRDKSRLVLGYFMLRN